MTHANATNPAHQPVHQPPEWAPHKRCWTAWPSHEDLWAENLAPARAEVAAMIRAIAVGQTARGAPPTPEQISEPVSLLARGPAAIAAAEADLDDLVASGAVDIIDAPLGDIWLRDTGPLFVTRDGERAASTFAFNGWGGKYRLPDDDKIASIVVGHTGVKAAAFDFVLEGGAIDTDGDGTFLTTRQCLLNANRNPGKSEADVEATLKAALGAQKVIWLDDGLANDHTDGHIDNIARFIAPGTVVCMRPNGADDPNAAVYNAIRRTLETARDAGGRTLDVIEIPSPGLILNDDGEPMPASHLNFYIANNALVMPHYGDENAQAIAETLARACGRPHAFALSARALLSGGGAFHCITQQQPETPDAPQNRSVTS